MWSSYIWSSLGIAQLNHFLFKKAAYFIYILLRLFISKYRIFLRNGSMIFSVQRYLTFKCLFMIQNILHLHQSLFINFLYYIHFFQYLFLI
uniref:Uncharacterized protein n=1 Tax=Heterorhabditis bacteriophora TaxID=37862 RepID=A0A1I7WVF6_HETBA